MKNLNLRFINWDRFDKFDGFQVPISIEIWWDSSWIKIVGNIKSVWKNFNGCYFLIFNGVFIGDK